MAEVSGNKDCALCGEAIPALKEVMEHYGARLRTLFRYAYRLPNDDGRRAEVASLCAGAQGRFIDFHQVLYNMDAIQHRV
jgi:protein-disulfide isomerase